MSVPHLQQLITIQMTGNRRIATQIRQMNQNFDQLGRRVDRVGRAIQNSMARSSRATQRTARQTRTGLTNIQSGLVQLSTWLLNVNVKINNVFSNMKTRFTEAETAMTQLKITMGLSGKTAVDSSVDFQRFAEASSQIDLLARTTQFTKREVAEAFTALIQSGRTVDEASKMIASTLRFATSSGGMLNLTESVDLATLTIGTLGGSVNEVDGNLNMLLKTSQKTKIGFKDLRQVMQSMRASYTKFSEVEGVSREAELMATAAALRTLGLSAGNTGQVINQFSRSMDTMYNTLNKVFMMDARVGGKGGKRPRFSYKRGALAELFGVGRFSVEDLQKQLNTTETDLRKLQDRFLMGQIFQYDKTGVRGSRRSLSDFLTRLLKAYSDVVKRRGEGPADALIQSAVGTAGASTLIKSIISLAKTAGKSIDQAADHYLGLVKELQVNGKEMMKADEEAKTTIAYRTKVLDSAIAALSNTIFEQDLVAISALDTYKEMISATNTLMRSNKSLASSTSLLGRGFQLLTNVGTNIGFALVAAATFSTALTFATNATGVAVTGLSATLGSFARIFLLPTVTVVGQLTLALGGLGLATVALINYFSDGVGVAKGFKVMLDEIKFSAMAAGGMVNALFSTRLPISPIKELVDQLDGANDQLFRVSTLGGSGSLHILSEAYRELSGHVKATKDDLKVISYLPWLPDDLGSKLREYLRLSDKLSKTEFKLRGTLGRSDLDISGLNRQYAALSHRVDSLKSDIIMVADYDPTANLKRLVQAYYKSMDRLSELEKRIFVAKESGGAQRYVKELTQDYDRLGRSVSIMKSALGEAGYVGLDALDARGARGLAVTLAGLIQLARDLVYTFRVVAEGAVVPLTYAMDALMFILSAGVAVALAPLRLLAYVFGQASDQASTAARALKFLGYALGAFLAFRMLSFFFGMFRSGLNSIVGGFTRASNAVSGYTTRTTTLLNNASQQVNLHNSRNASAWARAEVFYAAITGSVERYGRAHIRLARNQSFVGQTTLRLHTHLANSEARMRSFIRTSRGMLITMGGAITSVGALMSMGMLGEHNAELGTTIMMYSMLAGTLISVVSALVPVITAAFTIMTASVGGFIAVVAPLLLLLAGVVWLYGYLTKPTSTYTPSYRNPSTSTDSIPYARSSVGGVANFGSPVTPQTSGMVASANRATPIDLVANPQAAPQTVNDYSHQTNLNIDRAVFQVNGASPEDLKRSARLYTKSVVNGQPSFSE